MVVTTGGGGVTGTSWVPGMPVNILRSTGQFTATKDCPLSDVSMTKVEKLWSKE